MLVMVSGGLVKLRIVLKTWGWKQERKKYKDP